MDRKGELMTHSEMIDAENFAIGTNNSEKSKPIGCNLPKLLEYLKRTGKNYSELKPEELKESQ